MHLLIQTIAVQKKGIYVSFSLILLIFKLESCDSGDIFVIYLIT